MVPPTKLGPNTQTQAQSITPLPLGQGPSIVLNLHNDKQFLHRPLTCKLWVEVNDKQPLPRPLTCKLWVEVVHIAPLGLALKGTTDHQSNQLSEHKETVTTSQLQAQQKVYACICLYLTIVAQLHQTMGFVPSVMQQEGIHIINYTRVEFHCLM